MGIGIISHGYGRCLRDDEDNASDPVRKEAINEAKNIISAMPDLSSKTIRALSVDELV